MESQSYPIPAGLHVIPEAQLDLRPDSEVDHDLSNPKPVSGEKNVWFFWHQGYHQMHPYTQRNVRAWHRRLTKHGWVIRVLDRVPGSPLNIANFLDIADPGTFPAAFIEGTIGGDYAPQHTSDLVRFPLLIKYGGVYADVGMIQIGDLDRLWNATIGDPDSRFEVISYNQDEGTRSLNNYFLVSNRNNPLFLRCHRLLLELWAADGGKTSTKGMHTSPLLKGVPPMKGDWTIEEEGKPTIGPEEVGRILSDYIIQGQVIIMVMQLIDEEDGWNGPEYVAEHVYCIDFMVGSQLINEYTEWNGFLAFELMSLHLPKEGESENDKQKRAREIVEGCLRRSFGFKLAHGLILKVYKATLGSLWRQHEGSDDIPGTYAHWLRHATIYWNQDDIPPAQRFTVLPPIKRGPLLREV